MTGHDKLCAKNENRRGYRMGREENKLPVIPGRAISAFTRVFDALWREPRIQRRTLNFYLDAGFAA
jgi:hypothetical protein